MIKKGFMISMVLFIVSASCNKVTEPVSEFTGNKIRKISYSNSDETVFTYIESLLKKLTFKEGSVYTDVLVSYDNNKKISEIRMDDGLVYRMRYALGEITVIDIFNAQNSRIAFIEISYTGGGHLRQMTTFTKRADPAVYPPSVRVTYNYYNDGKGNPSSIFYEAWMDALNDFIPVKTLELSNYDDKVNPLTHLRIIGYLFFSMNSANNPGKVIEKNENGTVVSTRQFIYNYHRNNLPYNAIESVNENGTTTTSNIFFNY